MHDGNFEQKNRHGDAGVVPMGMGDSPCMRAPHAHEAADVLAGLQSTPNGLCQAEAMARLQRCGCNVLPAEEPASMVRVFLHQFASPLIYVLVAAALVSFVIREWSDAGFICAVLLLNAIIGATQEYSAQRAATALQRLVTTHISVLREGDTYELNAEELVPGDIVLLESGTRVPADLRLFFSHDLEVDESLLTGESVAVFKRADVLLPVDSPLGDRLNMAFAGTMVSRGRARGVVTGTALDTQLGHIASAVLGKARTKAPLLVRMERFTRRVAIVVGLAALLMAALALARGMPPDEIFLLAVALAVSAIPEGLPVALTVALAISMQRMARRNVIIRRLLAVEALGSCTFIATDKTGTLTVNQLAARWIVFPGQEQWEITGDSLEPRGDIVTPHGAPLPEDLKMLEWLCRAAVLANEGHLGQRGDCWVQHGDAVDVALLVMAHKAGVTQAETSNLMPEIENIPFESERLFSASLNKTADGQCAFVKGALERLLPMCTNMLTADGPMALAPVLLTKQARELAAQGYRVLALAAGAIELGQQEVFSEEHLRSLTLLGLVGMIDPLRPEAKSAISACRQAGIHVAMVTGDHPATAYAIGRELELLSEPQEVVTGAELKLAADAESVDRLTAQAHVFARVEPQQKLEIVQSLKRSGHYVAVSGDGANDAPALRAAHVGVAMGSGSTDVARETADIIITDNNFASIVNGVEEGRIAYANVRKVIFLLISTGAAELVLFILALLSGLPLPLLAVQLLWLNLVTNGIQDVALAFEPGEGNELRCPPRPPRESIFNRLMIERVVLSAAVIGSVAFVVFQWLLTRGFSLDEARNGTLMLMVLFENIHVFNSRSESLSVFRHKLMRNPILLFGTVAAQLVHVGAMYTPWISDVLRIQPISLRSWFEFLLLSLTVLLAMELHKLLRRRLSPGK